MIAFDGSLPRIKTLSHCSPGFICEFLHFYFRSTSCTCFYYCNLNYLFEHTLFKKRRSQKNEMKFSNISPLLRSTLKEGVGVLRRIPVCKKHLLWGKMHSDWLGLAPQWVYLAPKWVGLCPPRPTHGCAPAQSYEIHRLSPEYI